MPLACMGLSDRRRNIFWLCEELLYLNATVGENCLNAWAHNPSVDPTVDKSHRKHIVDYIAHVNPIGYGSELMTMVPEPIR